MIIFSINYSCDKSNQNTKMNVIYKEIRKHSKLSHLRSRNEQMFDIFVKKIT